MSSAPAATSTSVAAPERSLVGLRLEVGPSSQWTPQQRRLMSLAPSRARRRVTWMLGDATTLPPTAVDAVTMTANVAQVFVHDQDWSATLGGVRGVLRDGGHLVFETRDPSFRGWQESTREQSLSVHRDGCRSCRALGGVTAVALPLVSFRHTFRFLDSGDVVTSHSTLRFRDRDEITASLNLSGFTIDEIRDAPDRPRREFVVIAHPTHE